MCVRVCEKWPVMTMSATAMAHKAPVYPPTGDRRARAPSTHAHAHAFPSITLNYSHQRSSARVCVNAQKLSGRSKDRKAKGLRKALNRRDDCFLDQLRRKFINQLHFRLPRLRRDFNDSIMSEFLVSFMMKLLKYAFKFKNEIVPSKHRR